MAEIRTPKGTPTPTPKATLWLLFESAEFVGVRLGLLLRGVLVLEGALELGVEVELLGVEDDDELSEDALETVINEAAPDGELKTVMVEYGYEQSVIVALVLQQSSPWPQVPSVPAQHQMLVSPSLCPPQLWIRVLLTFPVHIAMQVFMG